MKEITKTNEKDCTAVACATEKENPEAVAPMRKPSYRVEKSEDAYSIEVALPGVAKSGIEIAVERGVLTLTAERVRDIPEDWESLRRESSDAGYQLVLKLNAPVDETGINASAEDGILTLTLPVKEEAKAKKIEVN